MPTSSQKMSDQLLKQQGQNINQAYSNAVTQANQAYGLQSKALQQQQQQQQQGLNTGLGTLNEQAFMQNRQQQQGAQAQGLGGSGLSQLGALQGRMQQGQQANQMIQGYNQSQENLANQKMGLAQQLSQNVANAGLEKAQQQNVLGNTQYERNRQFEQENQAQFNDLLASSQNSAVPEATRLAAIDNALKNGTITQEQYDQMKGLVMSGGLQNFEYEKKASLWNLPSAVGNVLQTPFRALGALVTGQQMNEIGGGLQTYNYSTPQGNQSFKSDKDAEAYFKNVYSSLPYGDQININVGKTNGAVEFQWGGNNYKSYQEAVNAIKGQSNG